MEEFKKNQLKNKDLIQLLYYMQGETIDNIIKKCNIKIKDELKAINLEKIIGNSENPRDLREIFNDIEENYNIKISKYNEELYKTGFIDGENLMINLLEK